MRQENICKTYEQQKSGQSGIWTPRPENTDTHYIRFFAIIDHNLIRFLELEYDN